MNYTPDEPPAINTHVVLNHPEIPAMTGWVVGHGHVDTTGSRGPVVIVVLDEEWQRAFTGPSTVGSLPIRAEWLAPVNPQKR